MTSPPVCSTMAEQKGERVMIMKGDSYEMSMLFDFYGDTLTEKQRHLFDCYYNQDLSLAEIAENEGITRQGVRDSIVRSQASMEELEQTIGLISRYKAASESFGRISRATAELRRQARGLLTEREIIALADEIDAAAAEIR